MAQRQHIYPPTLPPPCKPPACSSPASPAREPSPTGEGHAVVGVGVPLIYWIELKLMPLSQGAFLFNNAFYLVKTNLNQVTLSQSGSQLAWGQQGTGLLAEG